MIQKNITLICDNNQMIAQGLTVSSNERFDAFPSPLPQSVHHEEQQREDEEG